MRLGQSESGGDGCEEPPDTLPEPTDADRAELDEPLTRPLLAYSLDELMDELWMRFGNFVFVGEESVDDNGDRTIWRSRGSQTVRVGLAQRYLWRLKAEFDATQ